MVDAIKPNQPTGVCYRIVGEEKQTHMYTEM